MALGRLRSGDSHEILEKLGTFAYQFRSAIETSISVKGNLGDGIATVYHSYRADIDGLRAMAVVPVILFHAGFPAFGGGFVGVDVFFVISGYLITTILLNEMRSGTFSFANFYERRVRRILPALIVVMTVSVVLAWNLMVPSKLEDFSQGLIAVSLFASNMLFDKEDDYFGGPADQNPLLHTWSLAVEEQFYIAFPILLVAFWSLELRRLGLLVAGLAFFSFLLCEIGWRWFPVTNFFLTPTRAWELLLGSLIAFASIKHPLWQRTSHNLCEVLAAIGLLLILFSIFVFDDSTPFPSFYTLIPTIGAALVIAFGSEYTVAAKILSFRPLVGIGLISYSAYLWHQPIFAFARIDGRIDLNVGILLLLAGTTLILAYLTWRFVEQPFRNRSGIGWRPVVGITTSMTALLITFGILGDRNNGFYSRFGDFDWENAQYGGHTAKWISSHVSPKFILYGDSHALQYTTALDDLFKKQGYNYNVLAHAACLSLPEITNVYKGKVHDSCLRMLDRLIDQAEVTGAAVVLSQSWTKQLADRQGRDLGLEAESDDEFKVLAENLSKLVERLPAPQKLIIIGAVPKTGLKRGYIACAIHGSQEECAKSLPITQGASFGLRRFLEALSDKNDRILFIDPYLPLCDEVSCKMVEGDNLIYSDHGHLSVYGANKVLAFWRQEIMKFLNL